MLCRLLLFPPVPVPKPVGGSNDRPSSDTAASRAGSGSNTAAPKSSVPTDQTNDITYTWDNTCVFKISKESKLSVEPDHPWPLICSAAFCCAMVTRTVLRTSNYSLLVCSFPGSEATVRARLKSWNHCSLEYLCLMLHNKGDLRRRSRKMIVYSCQLPHT